jgi:hypothetical protein
MWGGCCGALLPPVGWDRLLLVGWVLLLLLLLGPWVLVGPVLLLLGLQGPWVLLLLME